MFHRIAIPLPEKMIVKIELQGDLYTKNGRTMNWGWELSFTDEDGKQFMMGRGTGRRTPEEAMAQASKELKQKADQPVGQADIRRLRQREMPLLFTSPPRSIMCFALGLQLGIVGSGVGEVSIAM